MTDCEKLAREIKEACTQVNKVLRKADTQGIPVELSYDDGKRHFGDMGPTEQSICVSRVGYLDTVDLMREES